MHVYHFSEATPLIKFIDEKKDRIIGGTLKRLDTLYWPIYERANISELPVILEMDDYCIVVNYLLVSDIEIRIGKKEALMKDEDAAYLFNIRNEMQDYYEEELELGIKKALIENCKIEDIQIERFSEAFECNSATGEMRPEGGDYFSVIRIYLDRGVTLCLCGVDAITDGYVKVWCE